MTDSTYRYQSEQKSVPVPGGILSYEVVGEGPAVLCLPSLGDTRREYDRVVPVLVEQGFRVVTTDLRGMGQSQGHFKTHTVADLSNDIKAILDAEGVEQAFLLGCSISGASAGLFAVEHPERVRALVGTMIACGSPTSVLRRLLPLIWKAKRKSSLVLQALPWALAFCPMAVC